MAWQDVAIREYGDGQHLVLYVEAGHPAFDRLSKSNGCAFSQNYYHRRYSLTKPVAKDFFFRYGNSNPKRQVLKRLQKILSEG